VLGAVLAASPAPGAADERAAAIPSPPSAAGTIELDLERAFALALERNLDLSLEASGHETARLAVAAAEAGFALRVAPELAVDRFESSDAATYGVGASRRFRLGTELRARAARTTASGGLPDQETWSVELSQPLLRRFGALIHEEPLVTAHLALAAAERRLAEQRADLILEVVTAYENLLKLERQVVADRKSVERARLLDRSTEAQERLGRATRIDTLRVGLQLGQLETRLEGSGERLELAHQDLAVLLGAESGTRFALAATPRLELDLPPLEEALEIALARRPDYAQALADAADGGRRTRIARRELLPDLAATLRYDHWDGLPGAETGTLLVAVRMSGDLLMPEARIAVSRAQVDEEAERKRVRIVEQLVARDVERAWLAVRRSRAEVPLLERNLEHAQARLRLASRLFEVGRGDNFTVVDAEAAFVDAESRLLDGRAAETIDGYRLLRALGNLVEVPERLRPSALLAREGL
jgi:outer membrane protein TolC